MRIWTLLCDGAAQAAETATQAVSQSGAESAPAQPSALLQLAPFFIIIVVFMFLMSRSQKKQAQKRQQMIDRIVKGTEVMLTCGIYGKIAEVSADEMLVEISDGVKIKVNKNGISQIIEAQAQDQK